MGAQEDRRDRGKSGREGEGLKRTGVWIREIKGVKGAKLNLKKMEKKGEVLNEKSL